MKLDVGIFLCRLTAFMALTGVTSLAQKNASPSPAENIVIHLEYVEMSHATMIELMTDPASKNNDTILRSKIEKLIQTKKAEVIETQIATMANNSKTTIKSAINEFIYATEFITPKFLQNKKTNKDKAETDILETPLNEHILAPIPVAFETRESGSFAHVIASIQKDQRFISLQLKLECTELTGKKIWRTWKDKYTHADITTPMVYTMRINTTAIVADGQPSLVGVLSPADNQANRIATLKRLVFVTATAN